MSNHAVRIYQQEEDSPEWLPISKLYCEILLVDISLDLYLSWMRYRTYLSSGENFGGWGVVDSDLQIGQIFSRVYLLQALQRLINGFIFF